MTARRIATVERRPPGRENSQRSSSAKHGGRAHRPPSVPWVFAAPALTCAIVLYLLPNVSALYYSLTQWDGLTHPSFRGVGNFVDLYHDDGARRALRNTLLLAGVFALAVNVIGLALAVGTHRVLKSRNFLRALFFAPLVISPLAVSYVWQYMLQPEGPVNAILGGIGLGALEHPWLGDPTTALWVLVIPLVWQFSGFAMVVYLAGLQGIPEELYEASSVDGASALERFRSITLPQLAPSMTVVVALSTIIGLRLFDQVLALTGGGPANATETLATELYQQAFTFTRFGYATALAVVLSALIIAITVVQIVVLRRREARYA